MRIIEKEFCMKSQTLRIALCLVASTLLMTAGAWAASTGRLQAQVPFSFYAADQLLPAGSYVISCVGNSRAIKIQSKESPDFAVVLTMPASPGKNSGSYLTFYRYGAETFLRAIQSGDATIGGALWQTHKEKELAADLSKSRSGDNRLAGPVQVTIQLKGE
jgi:hypothetical protein